MGRFTVISVIFLLPAMLIGLCLLGLSAGLVRAATIPQDRLQALLGGVLRHVEEALSTPRPIPDFSFQTNKMLFGLIPLELRLEERNLTMSGPERVGGGQLIRGATSPDSRSFHLTTQLNMDALTLNYGYLLIDVFGYKFEGVAKAKRSSLVGELSLRLEPAEFGEECRLVSSVSILNSGEFSLQFGQPKDPINFISQFLMFGFERIVQYVLGDVGQPPDTIMVPHLTREIMSALDGYKNFC